MCNLNVKTRLKNMCLRKAGHPVIRRSVVLSPDPQAACLEARCRTPILMMAFALVFEWLSIEFMWET